MIERSNPQMPVQGRSERHAGRCPQPGAAVVHLDDASSATAVPREADMARRLCGPRLDLPDESLLTIPGLLFHVANMRAAQAALRVKRRGLYRETKWTELADQVTLIGRG